MPGKKTSNYSGLFWISAATLMYELLLTRFFSVLMWYHFAFMAVSLAMLGMTAGAVFVYTKPKIFENKLLGRTMTTSSLMMAFTALAGLVLFALIPLPMAVIFLIAAVPFFFSGVVICAALTRSGAEPGKMYAADLAGSGTGCLVYIGAMQILDGVTAGGGVALLAILGAFNLAAYYRPDKLKETVVKTGAGLGILVLMGAGYYNFTGRSAILIRQAKNRIQPVPLVERWNSFSRVMVFGDPNQTFLPEGYGLSLKTPAVKIPQLGMNIDSSAFTVITRFDGNLTKLNFLKYDITNFGYYLVSSGKVLVIGSGGGRDVLSALVMGQKSVTGVEINQDINDIVHRKLGDYTGYLKQDPRVRIVTDEARSYIARADEKYDAIQISLIDTWASVSTGAYALTENSLYTAEAWQLFFEHLSDRGILTVSRWYNSKLPAEVYRLVTLARAGLQRLGVTDATGHVIIAVQKLPTAGDKNSAEGVATVIAGKKPFKPAQLAEIKKVADDLGFELLYIPGRSADPDLPKLLSGQGDRAVIDNFPANIAAPTDDSPYFFQMSRLMWGRGSEKRLSSGMMPLDDSSRVLGNLLLMVTVLTLVLVIFPMVRKDNNVNFFRSVPFLIFFAGIGMGFMMTEIGLMQRLMIFLGHPIYSVTVVLFLLLVCGGAGSFVAGKYFLHYRWLLGALLGVLVLAGEFTSGLVSGFQSQTTPVRIGLTVLILVPLSFLMGMPFGIGLKLANREHKHLTPWFWAINGAVSVLASVLAVIVAISRGIHATIAIGIISYAVAFAALMLQKLFR